MRRRLVRIAYLLVITILANMIFSVTTVTASNMDENDVWKEVCDWVEWDGTKLVNTNPNFYTAKDVGGYRFIPQPLYRKNGETYLEMTVKNISDVTLASKTVYINMVNIYGVRGGYFTLHLSEMKTNASQRFCRTLDRADDTPNAIYASDWCVVPDNLTSENELWEPNPLPTVLPWYKVECDWMYEIEDGYFFNTSPKVGETKYIGAYKFENMQFTTDGVTSSFCAKVTNISSQTLGVTTATMYLYDKEGNFFNEENHSTVGVVISDLEPGESTDLYANQTFEEYAHAYNWYISDFWTTADDGVTRVQYEGDEWKPMMPTTTPYVSPTPTPDLATVVKDYPWWEKNDDSYVNKSPKMDVVKRKDGYCAEITYCYLYRYIEICIGIKFSNICDSYLCPRQPIIVFYNNEGEKIYEIATKWLKGTTYGDENTLWYSVRSIDPLINAYDWDIVGWNYAVDEKELQTSTQAPTNSPVVTEKPTETEPPVVTELPQKTENPETPEAPSKGNDKSTVKQPSLPVLGVKATCTTENNVKLTWRKHSQAKAYQIMRSTTKKGKYKKIKILSAGKLKYTDKTAKKGKMYYYKILPVYTDGTGGKFSSATAVKVKLYPLDTPEVRLAVKKTSDKKSYIQVRLTRYEGIYVEIYFEYKGRFKKLFAKKKPIRSYGGKFRFGYKQGGRTMRLKARTYTMKRGKKQYSNYSAIKELKI